MLAHYLLRFPNSKLFYFYIKQDWLEDIHETNIFICMYTCCKTAWELNYSPLFSQSVNC